MRALTKLSELPDGVEGLERNLSDCRSRAAAAAERSGRSPVDVRLLVVSKYVDVDVVRALHDLGVRDFGENRVQGLGEKAAVISEFGDSRLHFIGHLQRNKARKALESIDSLHSVDSLRLLEEIEKRSASSSRGMPDIWIEFNISGESQKTGLDLEAGRKLLETIVDRPMIRGCLRGLMGMAARNQDVEMARPAFRRLRELRDACMEKGTLPEDAGLSMGMSRDFEIAIEEGATVVRVGSMLYA